ncbi:Spo0E family sporulation regulatory protein-aspartic acid phosphatase [Falsibacillus pallidus]|uniref:Spo0E family sporulation regulatory protein-aspartic acid phosphatase n=1 Tax=Falsibacillus pallidus TaxID=493781 RepID=UPI003D95E183
MESSLKQLLNEIEENRSLMVKLALESSFADEKVVKISWKLDHLLNTYDELVQKIS